VLCLQIRALRGPAAVAAGRCRAPSEKALLASAVTHDSHRRRRALSASDPHYDAASDTYRQIYKGHPSASAVTNAEGVTVFFDPETNEVLGFSIAGFSTYYENHRTPEGEFEVSLPARVPANIEEEMDFDAESLRSGVRIAEFY
jgi:hypothetical protein